MATAARIGIEIGAAFAKNFRGVFDTASAEMKKVGAVAGQLQGKLSGIDAFQKLTADTKAAGHAWQAAKAKAEGLAAAIGATGTPTKKQAAELRKAQEAADRAGAAFSRSREKLGEMRAALDKSGVSTKNLAQEQKDLQRQLDATVTRMKRVGDAQAGMDRGKSMMASAGMAIGAVTAAAATAGLPIVQAAKFETAMLGVAKQVEGARDAGGKLTAVYYQMARQVQELGREIPLATNEIAEMVAAGARMGVAKDELIAFTRTAAMMADAFELPAGELAEQMGKIAGLYKIPIPAIGGLADAINYLDDNAISKGGDIIDFLTRVGGVASSVKVTGNQMAALGSTMLTMGERAETASTAVNSAFSKLAAADKGTKGFKSAMDELGLSLADVQKGMQVDAMGTFMKVLDSVGKLDAEKQLGVLVELFSMEHADSIAKLANNTEEFRKQLAMANSEAAKGSMGKEFAARLETTNAQWQIARNRIGEVSVNLGTLLLPAINNVLSGMGSMTSGVADFVRENQVLVGNVAAVVGTLGAIFTVSKLATFGLGAITFAFNALKLAVITNPIGLALTALAVAGVLLWKNWEGVKGGLLVIWDQISSAAIAAFDAVRSAIGSAMDWIGQKVEAAKAWFAALPGVITGYFAGLPAQMLAIGGQIIDGLVNGLKARWESAKEFVGSIPGQIADKFKSTLGIRSPSRVFMGIGSDTMAGLEIGLKRSEPSVLNRMGALAGKLAAPIVATASMAVAAPALPNVIGQAQYQQQEAAIAGPSLPDAIGRAYYESAVATVAQPAMPDAIGRAYYESAVATVAQPALPDAIGRAYYESAVATVAQPAMPDAIGRAYYESAVATVAQPAMPDAVGQARYQVAAIDAPVMPDAIGKAVVQAAPAKAADVQPAGEQDSAPAVSAVPAAGSSQNITQTIQPVYNISVQGSATDPQETARAIRAELDRREREKAAARRSAMTDSIGY